MTIYIGGTKINDIRIGSTAINKVYKGSQLIWSRNPLNPESGWNSTSSSGNNGSHFSNVVTIVSSCTLKFTTTLTTSGTQSAARNKVFLEINTGSGYPGTGLSSYIWTTSNSGNTFTVSLNAGDQIRLNYWVGISATSITASTTVVNNTNNNTLDTFSGTHSGSSIGGGGGGGCFLADSQITLADLSTKPITEIKAGDRVLGDGMVNEVVELREIEQQSRTIYTINHLKTTDSHPILTSDGWKAIDPLAALEIHPEMTITELKQGDSLVCINESGEQDTQIVNSITSETLNTKVYNLNVTGSDTPDQEGNDTYIVDGIVVHNK